MIRAFWVAALALMLVGCSPSDEQTSVEDGDALLTETDRPAPAEQRQVVGGSSPEAVEAAIARRDRLREQMQAAELDAQRDRSLPWWRDPAIQETLALSENQQIELEERAASVNQARERLNRDVQATQRELAEAMSQDDQELADQARHARANLQQQLDQLDQDWRQHVRSLLDDDQLQLLEENESRWGRVAGGR